MSAESDANGTNLREGILPGQCTKCVVSIHEPGFPVNAGERKAVLRISSKSHFLHLQKNFQVALLPCNLVGDGGRAVAADQQQSSSRPWVL